MIRRRSALGFALFMALVLLDFGCTGSDELVSESGNLQLEVVMSPSGSGRYETSLIRLNQITFRPADPVADTSLGAVPFGMLTGPISLSLQDTASVTTSPVSLSDGNYELVAVILDNPILQDFDPILSPVTCLDGVLQRTQGKLPSPEINSQVVADKLELGPFSPPVVFTVPRLGTRTLRMFIDAPTLTALFEQTFTCRPTGFCDFNPTPIRAPCLSAFTPLTTAQLQPLFRFE